MSGSPRGPLASGQSSCLAVASGGAWPLEVPALAAGAVTLDRPRAAMMEMAPREPMGPGLAPGLGAPPLWTVLHPLQSVWPESEPVPEAGPPRLRSPPQPAPPAVSDDAALTLGGGQGRNGHAAAGTFPRRPRQNPSDAEPLWSTTTRTLVV